MTASYHCLEVAVILSAFCQGNNWSTCVALVMCFLKGKYCLWMIAAQIFLSHILFAVDIVQYYFQTAKATQISTILSTCLRQEDNSSCSAQLYKYIYFFFFFLMSNHWQKLGDSWPLQQAFNNGSEWRLKYMSWPIISLYESNWLLAVYSSTWQMSQVSDFLSDGNDS